MWLVDSGEGVGLASAGAVAMGRREVNLGCRSVNVYISQACYAPRKRVRPVVRHVGVLHAEREM